MNRVALPSAGIFGSAAAKEGCRVGGVETPEGATGRGSGADTASDGRRPQAARVCDTGATGSDVRRHR